MLDQGKIIYIFLTINVKYKELYGMQFVYIYVNLAFYSFLEDVRR
jgi:hypothetical protein